MVAYFLDSSAAVKLYVVEPGTAWLTKLVDPADSNEIFVVRITPVEIAAALVEGLEFRDPNNFA